MKGYILSQIIAYGAAAGALRYPLIGLYVYVGFATLRPQFLFGWAGDLSGLSFLVGCAMLVGWTIKGFGSWRFGRGRSTALWFLAFFIWFLLSAALALSTGRAYASVIDLAKTVLPVLVGITMIESEKHWRGLLWTIVLAQGYVGFEMNLEYLRGYNLASVGFGGMDNNFFGATLVTVIGPAVALAIASRTWYERALASAAAALILHTTLLTFSRGAFLGLLAVAGTAFVMMPKRPRYVGAVLITILVGVRFTGPELAARYSTIFVDSDERDASAQSRVELWRDCLQVIREYPMFGVGPANWRTIAARYGWSEGKSAHSVWMETAAENGIPGALFLLAFFATAAIKLWPLARARLTDENRGHIALASGVILSMVGFIVSGQFVSAPNLEVPYYIAMLGIAMLKTDSHKVGVRAAVPSVPALGRAMPALGQPHPTVAGRSSAIRLRRVQARYAIPPETNAP